MSFRKYVSKRLSLCLLPSLGNASNHITHRSTAMMNSSANIKIQPINSIPLPKIPLIY